MLGAQNHSNHAISGALRPSYRSYHWLFVWTIFIALLVAVLVKRGWVPGTGMMIVSSSFVFGYMFFIDISDKIWWTADQIWWRAWDYLSIRPMRHTVRIDQLTEVKTAYHPANFVQGKPFDRFELVGSVDTITILPSFFRREELEDLLRLIQARRPDALVDPLVLNFMNGEYSEWWRYRSGDRF